MKKSTYCNLSRDDALRTFFLYYALVGMDSSIETENQYQDRNFSDSESFSPDPDLKDSFTIDDSGHLKFHLD